MESYVDRTLLFAPGDEVGIIRETQKSLSRLVYNEDYYEDGRPTAARNAFDLVMCDTDSTKQEFDPRKMWYGHWYDDCCDASIRVLYSSLSFWLVGRSFSDLLWTSIPL